MAKISELELVEAPAGDEPVVILKDGEAKAAALAALVSAAVGPAVTQAEGARDQILNDPGFIAIAADLSGANRIGEVAAALPSIEDVAGNALNINLIAANIEDIASLVAPLAPVTITLARTLSAADLRRSLFIEIDTPDLMVTQIPIPSNSEEALALGAAFVGTNTGTGLIQFVPDAVGGAVITPAKAGYVYVPPGGSFRLEQRTTDEWVLSGVLSNEANAFTLAVLFEPVTDAVMKQERTGGSATTPTADGEVVGTWVNKGTGPRYAVARSDVRRPVRDADADGFEVITTDGNATAANADFLELLGLDIDMAKLHFFVAFKPLAYQFGDGIVSLAPVGQSGDASNSAFAISQNALSAAIPTDFAFNMGVAPNRLSVGVQGMQPERPHVVAWRKAGNNVPATITVDGFTITHEGAVGLPALANVTAMVEATVRLIIGANPGNEGQNGAIQHSNTAYNGIALTDTVLNDTQFASVLAYLDRKTLQAGPVLPNWADLTELEAARTTLITEVFGTGTLPTDLATLATDAAPPVTGLTNLASVQKMTIPGEADAKVKPRLWTPNNPRSDVVCFVWAGHAAGWNANGVRDQVIQPMLTAGVRVVSLVLPDGPNDYTSGSPTNHATNLTAYAKWFRQNGVAVNTLLDICPGADVIGTGISGGGWACMTYGAMDPRVTSTVQVCGSIPSDRYLNRDYEQWMTQISADYYDLYLMAAADGRRHIQILREDDAAGFSRAVYESRPPYEDAVAEAASSLGGGFFDLQILPGALHTFNTDDTATLLAELP